MSASRLTSIQQENGYEVFTYTGSGRKLRKTNHAHHSHHSHHTHHTHHKHHTRAAHSRRSLLSVTQENGHEVYKYSTSAKKPKGGRKRR